MPEWSTWTLVVLGLLVLGVLVPVIGLIGRRRWLSARGRVFDCSLQPADATPGFGWMLGVARFQGETLQWFRVFSLSLRPWLVLDRASTHVALSRRPDAAEASVLYADHQVAELTGRHAGVRLAMAPQDLTAFLSWMESAPPGDAYRGL